MEELDELAELLLGAYALTGKLLTLLPIPFRLPSIEMEQGGVLGAQAMNRARVVIRDLPLDPRTVAVLEDLIFEWLIARDLCVLAIEVGPDAHRLRGLRQALARFSALSEEAERLLTPPHQGS